MLPFFIAGYARVVHRKIVIVQYCVSIGVILGLRREGQGLSPQRAQRITGEAGDL